MKRIGLFAFALSFAAAAYAQDSCPSGKFVPDLGYGLASCHNCLKVLERNGNLMLQFTGEPALFRIHGDGPAWGKLQEGDTLVRVDGEPVASEAAALRLNEFQPSPVRLTVRRGGELRTVSITPKAICASSQPVAAPPDIPPGHQVQLLPPQLRKVEEIVKAMAAKQPATEQVLALEQMIKELAAQMGMEPVVQQTPRAPFFAPLSLFVPHAPLVVDVPAPHATFTMRADSIAVMPSVLPDMSLGIGLLCLRCSLERRADGRYAWTFSEYPIVAGVESKSLAERIGLRRGDTLKTIDDLSLTTPRGGERLGAVGPGQTLKLGWLRDGVTHTASVTLDARTPFASPSPRVLQMSQAVGNTRVEVRGTGATWTRDPRTGEIHIRVDSVTVTVRPTPPPREDVPSAPRPPG